MFTLPPLPPKDYTLKGVYQNQISAQEHTPFGLPRITQSSLGKFLAPIEYGDKDKLEDIKIENVNPKVLERWTDKERAFWVEKPGKDDFFLHYLYKKYSVMVEPSYDARYKHKESVFYRSFKYELECLEEARLQRLYNKIKREEAEEKAKMDALEEKRSKIREKQQAINLGLATCDPQPPIWWKAGEVQEDKEEATKTPVETPRADTTTYRSSYLRWQDEPNYLIESTRVDPCRRRSDMALIGQTFRNEACNFYYNNYPPPSLRFIRKKFMPINRQK